MHKHSNVISNWVCDRLLQRVESIITVFSSLSVRSLVVTVSAFAVFCRWNLDLSPLFSSHHASYYESNSSNNKHLTDAQSWGSKYFITVNAAEQTACTLLASYHYYVLLFRLHVLFCSEHSRFMKVHDIYIWYIGEATYLLTTLRNKKSFVLSSNVLTQ